ncbi:plasmid partitioning/stability family protein [Escherichia coli]|uniref:plasmid partitioning/stability family protein n=1 Tax=Escherichia coli TaxID=562 RepID=UPI00063D217C|nr:plasmid partitioning/stability family protein [Escherichia coli]KLH04994.1 peptide transporter [Escherichia coli]
MTTPTRRISFYLKPVAVNSEQEACNYLDSLPASERSRAQRAAFLAGLALIKRDPAFAYWLAEWPEEGAAPAKNNIQSKYASTPATGSNHSTSEIRKNIQSFFPE